MKHRGASLKSSDSAKLDMENPNDWLKNGDFKSLFAKGTENILFNC